MKTLLHFQRVDRIYELRSNTREGSERMQSRLISRKDINVTRHYRRIDDNQEHAQQEILRTIF
jgi:hypothetical protein